MADLFFEVGKDSNVRKPLTLRPGDKGCRGASGNVYELLSEPGKGIKDYHAEERAKFEPKIRAMIRVKYNRPHIDRFDLAWPETLVGDLSRQFRGFKMPFFGSGWVDLEKLMQASEAQKKYGLGERHRLMIGANLAMAIKALHDLKVYCIDLKPENVRVNLSNVSVAIIDCDGMSVVDIGMPDSQRFYADKCTPEFWAPENIGLRPHKFQNEEAHDRFALATIIFMLLNRGLHPYQGIMAFDEPGTETVAGKIKNNLYPYGPEKGRITPHQHSLYPFLPDETQKLFNRAFMDPSSRPSADEWLSHLNRLALRSERCEENPEYHIKYPGLGCPVCAFNKTATGASQWAALVGSSVRPKPNPINTGPPPPTAPPTVSTGVSISASSPHVRASPASSSQSIGTGGGESGLISVLTRIGMVGIVVVVIIGIFYLFAEDGRKSSPGTTSSTVQTSSISGPVLSPPPIVKPPPPPSPIAKAIPPPPPAPLPKPSLESVIRSSRLIGVWAPDCNRRPSDDNEYSDYSVTQSGEGRISSDNGRARHELVIRGAETLADNKVELILEQLPQRTGVYLALLMEGNRYRVWTAGRANGQILVRDGVNSGSGQQTLWRVRCGSSPAAAQSAPQRCFAGAVTWNCDVGWRCGQMPGTCQR